MEVIAVAHTPQFESSWKGLTGSYLAQYRPAQAHLEALRQDGARLEANMKLCDDRVQQSTPLRGYQWAHHQALMDQAFTPCMYRLGYYRARASAPAAKATAPR